MHLNDLLGRRVEDAAGDDIGAVADVRLIEEDGVLRVDGLIVVEGRSTELLGYERHVAPALLRWLVHRRLGAVRYLPWQHVDHIDDAGVHARATAHDLTPLEAMPRY